MRGTRNRAEQLVARRPHARRELSTECETHNSGGPVGTSPRCRALLHCLSTRSAEHGARYALSCPLPVLLLLQKTRQLNQTLGAVRRASGVKRSLVVAGKTQARRGNFLFLGSSRDKQFKSQSAKRYLLHRECPLSRTPPPERLLKKSPKFNC